MDADIHMPWRWLSGPNKGELALDDQGGVVTYWCSRGGDRYSEDAEAITCVRCRELVLLSVEQALRASGLPRG